MIIPADTTVYCDANFLVAYGAKQVRQPQLQKRARVLFAKLLIKGCKIAASPLSFDEAWNGIRREAGPRAIRSKPRFFINRLLDRIGVRLMNDGITEFSYSDILNEIEAFTKNLIDSSKFTVIQFPSREEAKGVYCSIENMGKFGLRPRDSFHLSIMQLNDIHFIMSRDTKFQGTGINVLTF